MGVIAIAVTFASLMAMPFISTTHIGSPKFRSLSERAYFVFAGNLFLLTWVGAAEIMDPTITLGQICTVFLFVYLVIIYPLLPYAESFLYLYGARLLNDFYSAIDNIGGSVNSGIRASVASNNNNNQNSLVKTNKNTKPNNG